MNTYKYDKYLVAKSTKNSFAKVLISSIVSSAFTSTFNFIVVNGLCLFVVVFRPKTVLHHSRQGVSNNSYEQKKIYLNAK